MIFIFAKTNSDNKLNDISIILIIEKKHLTFFLIDIFFERKLIFSNIFISFGDWGLGIGPNTQSTLNLYI
jgi:hypothetical protein